MRAWLPLCLALAGCTDIFDLPFSADAQLALDAASSDSDGDTAGGTDALASDTDAGPSPVLPASCAFLSCKPASLEPDVVLTDGTVSGCHAYKTLSIASLGTVTVGMSNGLGFIACADHIYIGGTLTANGQGLPAGTGPGAGQACGSGASHGGAGADPGGCGTGATYGDPNLPEELGSGGGGTQGGAGGGLIELSAGQIDVLGLVSADGRDGQNGSGGGSGGSVLLHAGTIDGAGGITARGGDGATGGGGGGRVAVRSANINASLRFDVHGGASGIGASGSDGTIVRMP